MNKAIKILSLIILLGAIGFGVYKLFLIEEKKEQTETISAQVVEGENSSNLKEALIPVKVVTSARGDLPLRKSITGIAEVWEKAVIKAEESGKVEDIHCKIGQLIKRGDLLIKIDDFEQALNVENRKANKLKTLSNYLVKETAEAYVDEELTEKQKKELKELKDKYSQAIKDFDKGKIDEKEFEKISSAYDKMLVLTGESREEVFKAMENLTQDIIELKRAEMALKRTSIKSPFPGVIVDIMVSKGEKVTTGQDVVKVVNLDSLYLKGYALESELQKLKTGIKIRVKFDSFPDQYFQGEIESISPEVNPENKTIPIYVKIQNKEHLFYPGMHAELDIEYSVQKDVVKVPIKAITTRQGRYVIFVIRDIDGTTGTAMWEYVEVGEKNDEEQEIISGIQPGDLIVIEGQMTLAHQSRVKIIK